MGAISAISSILPVLTGAAGIVQTVGRTINAVGNLTGGDPQQAANNLALKQLKQKQKLEEQQLSQQTDLQRQQQALQSAQDDQTRQLALRRAVARQRAEFGAQGLGSNDGSSDAVLLGMFDESDAERAQREQMDALRSNALDLNTEQNRSLNLLQATQLAQRQNLSQLYDS